MAKIITPYKIDDQKTFIPCDLSETQALYDPKIRNAFSIGNAIQSLKRQYPTTRIGFTNGKFRQLTPAHSVFFSHCKMRCNLLIVAINSDYSLRLLKEKNFFPDKQRAFQIAQHEVINYVCLFDEENPYKCILECNVDVIFKGAPDYLDKEVISAGKPVELIEVPIKEHLSDYEQKGYKYFNI